MTLYRPLHFHLCSQSRCPLLASPRTPTALAQNPQRRSDAVLDQPLVDKMHSPSTVPSRPVVLWVSVIPSFEHTHSSQMYFSVNQRRTLELLVALGVTSDLFPASLPSDMTEITARHTTVNRIWIDRILHRRPRCSPFEEPVTHYDNDLSVRLPDEPNLCFYPSSQPLARIHVTPRSTTQHICKSQNKLLGSEHPG
jgi:hypothetical protein